MEIPCFISYFQEKKNQKLFISRFLVPCYFHFSPSLLNQQIRGNALFQQQFFVKNTPHFHEMKNPTTQTPPKQQEPTPHISFSKKDRKKKKKSPLKQPHIPSFPPHEKRPISSHPRPVELATSTARTRCSHPNPENTRHI